VFALSKTEDELEENIIKAVKISFWIGVRLQQVVPFPTSISSQRADILKEIKKHNMRQPTPMMSVLLLPPQVVKTYVDNINKMLVEEPERQLEVTLRNGSRNVVVVGHPESLHSLAMLLKQRETSKTDNLDQSRVPYSKRKREFRALYLGVSVPFHSHRHLSAAVPLLEKDLGSFTDLDWNGNDLQVPVYSTKDGSDLRTKGADLLKELVRLQSVNTSIGSRPPRKPRPNTASPTSSISVPVEVRAPE